MRDLTTLPRRALLALAGAGSTALAGCAGFGDGGDGGDDGFEQPDLGGEHWESEYVRHEDGWLTYPVDDDGHRVPDFGWAGYRLGEEPIPDVPTVERVGPVDGDNVDHLEAAMESVAEQVGSDDAPRGALELEPGRYPLESTLQVGHSGVVLRGAGDGADPASNTVLEPVGERSVGVVVGDASRSFNPDYLVETPITTEFVRVGDRSFEVESADPFAVGDNVLLKHPCTQAWIDAVEGGGTADDPDWEPASQPILYNRHVRAIDGTEVTVDAPVYNHLDRELATTVVHPVGREGLVTEAGIEDIRVEIRAEGDRRADDDHATHAVQFSRIEDGWATGCTVRNFVRSGVRTTGATRLTIRDVRAVDPFGPVEPGLRYNFSTESHSQLILFEDCFASRGRHCYVSNGTSTASGIVFHDVVAENPYNACEGHRRWTHGLLYDNYESRQTDDFGDQGRLYLGNRGSWGTGHGWAAAHSVAWNVDLNGESEGFRVEDPPTARNYAIGPSGPLMEESLWGKPLGHVEGHGEDGLRPVSLYETQREQRLARQE